MALLAKRRPNTFAGLGGVNHKSTECLALSFVLADEALGGSNRDKSIYGKDEDDRLSLV